MTGVDEFLKRTFYNTHTNFITNYNFYINYQQYIELFTPIQGNMNDLQELYKVSYWEI